MKLDYQVGKPSEELKKLKSSYDAHNQLLANMQLCGAFSEKLIERVFSLSFNALNIRIDKEKGIIKDKKSNEMLNGLYEDFQNLFNVYNIFSKEFKIISIGLFKTVCFYIDVD